MRIASAALVIAVAVSTAHADVELHDTAPPASEPEATRWLSLGGVLIPGANVGARLEVDVLAYGPITFGLQAQKAEDTMYVVRQGETRHGQVDDWSGGVTIASSIRFSGWELRAGGAALLLKSNPHSSDFDEPGDPFEYSSSWTYAVEVATSISRDLGKRWGISMTAAKQHIYQEWHGVDRMIERDTSPTLYALSLRRKL